MALPAPCANHQCPCLCGGSIGADSFHSFGIDRDTVIGVANKTVWKSSTGGVSWKREDISDDPSLLASPGWLQSLGPGLLFQTASGALRTTGDAVLQPGSATARGTTYATMTLGAAGQVKRTLHHANISWRGGPAKGPLCFWKDYSGEPVQLGAMWLKTARVKWNCTLPPSPPCCQVPAHNSTCCGQPGCCTLHLNTVNLWLYASKDLLAWTYRGTVATPDAVVGSE